MSQPSEQPTHDMAPEDLHRLAGKVKAIGMEIETLLTALNCIAKKNFDIEDLARDLDCIEPWQELIR
jgi:hypothetical protein